MSKFDYEQSKQLAMADPSFYALIMAAMRKADTGNMALLEHAFPATARELQLRYDSPGGYLPEDPDVPEEIVEQWRANYGPDGTQS